MFSALSSREAIFPFASEYCYGTYRPFYFTNFTPCPEKKIRIRTISTAGCKKTDNNGNSTFAVEKSNTIGTNDNSKNEKKQLEEQQQHEEEAEQGNFIIF